MWRFAWRDVKAGWWDYHTTHQNTIYKRKWTVKGMAFDYKVGWFAARMWPW